VDDGDIKRLMASTAMMPLARQSARYTHSNALRRSATVACARITWGKAAEIKAAEQRTEAGTSRCRAASATSDHGADASMQRSYHPALRKLVGGQHTYVIDENIRQSPSSNVPNSIPDMQHPNCKRIAMA